MPDQHGAERLRDVPRSCICEWLWKTGARRWIIALPHPQCPWHLRGQP